MSLLDRPPGSGLPGRLLRRLARHPVLLIGGVSMGVRAVQEYGRMKKGEIDGMEFRARTAAHLGSISGGAAGATVGAAAGSVVPIVGTLIGGFVGGMVGEAGGSRLFRVAMEELEARRAGEPATGRNRRDL
ncbi:MAG: hypothetical protein U1E65_32905 [Myxococcota bacterium]